MARENLYTVFYCRDNLKRMMEMNEIFHTSKKFNLTIVKFFSDLIYTVNQQQVNLLIVDGESIDITDEFINVQKDAKFGIPDNIVYLGVNDTQQIDIDDVSRFCMSYNEFYKSMVPLRERILFNIEKNNTFRFDYRIVSQFLTEYLIRMGFLPKHMGFNYIKQCIEEALINNGVLGPLSTEVYPKVALRNNTNPINIERNIRNSITLAQKHCQDGVLNTIFAGSTVSNRAFLAYLLDQVIISYSQLDRSIKF